MAATVDDDAESASQGFQQQESLVRKYLRIFAVVSLYWIVSLSQVFINKSLLGDAAGSGNEDRLDAPVFVTWFQCLVSVILCHILAVILPLVCCCPAKLPAKLTLDHHRMWKVLPLSLVFVTMMTLNNLSLKHLGVAFYFVGRSLVQVFNVILTWFILGEKTSKSAILCCAIICVGFYLGVQQEGELGSVSVWGIIYGIFSSLFLALNAIYTKKVLPLVNQSVWLLGYYNNLNACLLFLPLMIFNGEMDEVMHKLTMASSSSSPTMVFWFTMLAGGIFGFSIGYAIALQVQTTSPLTNNISGTAKACAQTVLATQWYGEVKPWLWWLSNWVVLFGSAAYARVRQIEMEKNHRKENLLLIAAEDENIKFARSSSSDQLDNKLQPSSQSLR